MKYNLERILVALARIEQESVNPNRLDMTIDQDDWKEVKNDLLGFEKGFQGVLAEHRLFVRMNMKQFQKDPAQIITLLDKIEKEILGE